MVLVLPLLSWFTVEVVHRPHTKAATLCQRQHNLLYDLGPQKQQFFRVS